MSRGQAAFEYLLIIGGSVLFAAIVLMMVTGNLNTTNEAIDKSVNSYTHTIVDITRVSPVPLASPSPSPTPLPSSIPAPVT